MTPRSIAFVAVGAGGFVVQVTVLAILTAIAHWPVAIATAAAVEAAVLVNFWWHDRWTWRDRRDATHWTARLGRFHLANGAASLLGNVVMTSLGVRLLEMTPAFANVLAVGALAAVNYVVADRWVFARGAGIALTLLTLLPARATAAQLQPETLSAWGRYIARVEAELPRQQVDVPLVAPQGRMLAVPGGTIHEWRGTVLVRHCTVSGLINALISPGAPPPQEDVLESRVLERDGDMLRVYLKLVRTAVVTVAYDTEHHVRFARFSPSVATSRSVSTRIVETGGEDHGFLWRLNSYWRYTQVGDSVRIDMLSVSLSRAMPVLLKPVAAPIANRVARESMARTLDAVKRFGERLPTENADVRAGGTVGR